MARYRSVSFAPGRVLSGAESLFAEFTAFLAQVFRREARGLDAASPDALPSELLRRAHFAVAGQQAQPVTRASFFDLSQRGLDDNLYDLEDGELFSDVSRESGGPRHAAPQRSWRQRLDEWKQQLNSSVGMSHGDAVGNVIDFDDSVETEGQRANFGDVAEDDRGVQPVGDVEDSVDDGVSALRTDDVVVDTEQGQVEAVPASMLEEFLDTVDAEYARFDWDGASESERAGQLCLLHARFIAADPFEYGNREAIEATMTVLGQRHGLDLETVFAEENADALIAAEMDCIAEIDNPQAAVERLKTVYSDAMGVDIDLDDLDGKVLDEEDDRVEVVDSSRANNDVAEAASGDEFEVDNSLLEAIYGGQTFNEVRLDPARQLGDDSEQEGQEQRVSTAVERDASFDR